MTELARFQCDLDALCIDTDDTESLAWLGDRQAVFHWFDEVMATPVTRQALIERIHATSWMCNWVARDYVWHLLSHRQECIQAFFHAYTGDGQDFVDLYRSRERCFPADTTNPRVMNVGVTQALPHLAPAPAQRLLMCHLDWLMKRAAFQALNELIHLLQPGMAEVLIRVLLTLDLDIQHPEGLQVVATVIQWLVRGEVLGQLDEDPHDDLALALLRWMGVHLLDEQKIVYLPIHTRMWESIASHSHETASNIMALFESEFGRCKAHCKKQNHPCRLASLEIEALAILRIALDLFECALGYE